MESPEEAPKPELDVRITRLEDTTDRIEVSVEEVHRKVNGISTDVSNMVEGLDALLGLYK